MDRKALRQRFEWMSDEELLRRYDSGDMEGEALEVLADELRARGFVQAEAADEAPAAEEPEPLQLDMDSLVPMEPLQGRDDPLAVYSLLEAEGIAATSYTAFHAQGDPRLGVGSTRILVAAVDLARATEVLHAYRRGEYALGDED